MRVIGWTTISVALAFAGIVNNLPAQAQTQPPTATRHAHRAGHAQAPAADAEEQRLDREDARFFLTRTGFSPAESELDAYAGLTRREAVDRLLAQTGTVATQPPPAWVTEPIVPYNKLPDEDARKAARQKNGARELELRAWWMGEMIKTPSPLTERMTLFWHNHFVSSSQKVPFAQLMYRQNVLLRQDAVGNFGAMLHATAKDPAMLVYLDGAESRKGKPNENFAREVMELFTLGEGNYSEQDIKEAARAFTGWSIEPATGAFRWRPMIHDDGEKTVLGVSGRLDGDAVLDILLAQPQTAEHLTRKLWREFVSPTPDERDVRRIAARFRAAGYDLRVALRELLGSRAFWAGENRQALIKSPVDFVIGSFNSLGMEPPDAAALAGLLRQLGQDLFAPPNVKGWPGGETWINSSTLLARKQMAERLLRREGREDLRQVMLDPAYQLK